MIVLVLALLGQNWVVGPDNLMLPDGPMMGGQQSGPYVAPDNLFSVRVPGGWGIALHKDDPNTIDFRAVSLPGNGVLQIRRVIVPQGAHPRQLALNAVEIRLSKLPNFELVERRDVVINGNQATAVTGSYSHQGNLQFPVAVEEVHMVAGSEAFIFHFECFAPEASNLARDVNTFYASFVPRPVLAEPVVEPQPDPTVTPTKKSKKKRKPRRAFDETRF
ncbi:MAG: hypothetical protein A2289_01020 [Deltaproteobacteria bacterium RIFOXYA12_FULL_58_15]|nr:MAG: hypothetical protein A2289_01020 [Deltaproteobacteria bacterium RIFOXYA12_FULL_58_15]OGR14743.1 MAG: hypothetical protein A2341_05195 [Deltaproteobacteria bacterium RIFOXYB12_FULL_58_9]